VWLFCYIVEKLCKSNTCYCDSNDVVIVEWSWLEINIKVIHVIVDNLGCFMCRGNTTKFLVEIWWGFQIKNSHIFYVKNYVMSWKNRDVTNNILVSFKKKKCFRNNIYFEKKFKSSKI
jgi:hypothetical protein